ncbi:MAG: hypothetical protein A2138_05400 [Deltaproteobacteria bacterium RBG_16_71_12]|nr:MAG: hypothetical protein A2138_05400 [Deltaproteobacteria bacterium RBG_16_71_12]
MKPSSLAVEDSRPPSASSTSARWRPKPGSVRAFLSAADAFLPFLLGARCSLSSFLPLASAAVGGAKPG